MHAAQAAQAEFVHEGTPPGFDQAGNGRFIAGEPRSGDQRFKEGKNIIHDGHCQGVLVGGGGEGAGVGRSSSIIDGVLVSVGVKVKIGCGVPVGVAVKVMVGVGVLVAVEVRVKVGDR
jgi:hypothetical protein